MGQIFGKAQAGKASSGSGDGDMTKAVYDPSNKNANAFSTDNHIDGTTNKVFTATEKTKLSGIEAGANNYSLPTASAGTKGGVKVGTRLSIDGDGVLSADVQAGGGDTVAPATNTADYIPQWNGANSKTLKDGLAVPAGGLAGLTALGAKLDANTPITGATKTKITYDADGLVTAGADATTADIADSTNKRYVTDAQLTVIGNTSGTNTGDQDISGKLNIADIDDTPVNGETAAPISSNWAYDHAALTNAHLDWAADQGATNIHSGNIPDLSATYATAAKGVTNGDSHDHSGGDGAQIAYGSLSGTPTLGDAASKNVGTGAGTVCAGDDSRLSDARTPTAHNQAETTITFTDVTTGNASTTAHGFAPKATAPAAGLTNVVGIANGETAYTNKPLFDATVPSTQAYGDAAATGSATVAARRDHKHAIPAAPTDATLAFTDVTTNNASTTAHGYAPKATAPASGLLSVLGIGNGETIRTDKALFDTTNPAALGTAAPGTALVAARRDHVHAAPTTVSGNAGTATTLQNARTIDGVSFNGSANITVIAPATNAATTKATPIDADEIPITDSAASYVLKKLTWANLKATLKTYFDTLYLALAGGTLTGELNLGENAGLVYDAALSADGKYSGIVETGTAGAALAFGDLCYLDPTDSRWELCDANAAAGADGDSRGILGICVLAAAGDASATKMLLWGKVRADTAFPTMTINNPLYVSETAGDITGTRL